MLDRICIVDTSNGEEVYQQNEYWLIEDNSSFFVVLFRPGYSRGKAVIHSFDKLAYEYRIIS